MAHSKQKPWHPPQLKRLETLEEVLAYYQSEATPAELKKLEELVDQMRRAPQDEHAASRTRRNATG